MFDIGFWELMLIGVVALVVVGPERLPKLAYTAGKWVGKARRVLASVKTEIDKEIKAEELKQVLEEQKKQLNPLEEIVEETAGAVHSFKADTQRSLNEAERGFQGAPSENSAAAPSPTPADGGSDEPAKRPGG